MSLGLLLWKDLTPDSSDPRQTKKVHSLETEKEHSLILVFKMFLNSNLSLDHLHGSLESPSLLVKVRLLGVMMLVS